MMQLENSLHKDFPFIKLIESVIKVKKGDLFSDPIKNVLCTVHTNKKRTCFKAFLTTT